MSARHVTAASFAILWAVWSSFVGLPPSRGAQETSAEHRIDAVFAEWNRPDAPGCGVGVSRNGAITFERGYGMADLDAKIPISPATVFHVASISKQFTAAGACRRVPERGIGRHLPRNGA